jgi:hypothetical protein
MDETTKSELIRKASTAGLLRMNHVEAGRLLDWLIDHGFQYVGPNLEREQRRGKAHARDAEGNPIWLR